MRQATTVEKVGVPAAHHATSHVAMVGRRRWREIHHHREGIEGGSRGRVEGEMLATKRNEGEGGTGRE